MTSTTIRWTKTALRRVALVVGLVLPVLAASQVTRDASTFAELQAAVTASAASGDTINLTNDIVATSATTLNKSLTIRGNGRTITVPVPGLDESGVNEASPSAHRVFNISGSGVVVRIEQTTIMGGNIAGGGAIAVSSGSTLRLVASTITRSRGTATGGGGGIANSGGTVFIERSRLLRNSAGFGGGFLNASGSTTHVDRSLIAENRSERTSGGGGGGENQGSLFINNTTFSNNQSTEIGGGINNFNGTIIALNSTFSGNVGYGSTIAGGAIGVNGGTVRLANNLFAYNYVRTGGTFTNPTAFALDDVSRFGGSGTIESHFNIFHVSPVNHATTSNNIIYGALADGSDNTIFSGGLLARLTDGQGNEIGTAQVFRPFLVELPDGRAGTLQIGSYATDFANNPSRRGTQTGYDNTTSPARAGYFNGTSWVAWSGTSPESAIVAVDQLGNARTPPNIVRGGNSEEIDDVYMLRVNRATGGTVSGGSLYGDVYEAGTPISLTALANSGQQFVRWDCVAGCTGIASTDNPYAFAMPANNLTLAPVFAAQAPGQFTVTYAGNGNTAGSPPAAQTSTTSVVIASQGTLVRDGFTFTGWNTVSTGGGTAFAPGATYAPSPAANLTLQAQWVLNSSATAPGAPTIGTATAGDTQATVTFTAPASNGGAAITGYTVTSNPGGLTGTGTGSPIVVTGLSNGVSYTFTVTATNSAGTGAPSAPSNSVTPRANQTITFANPGAQTFGTTPTLAATASSGLAVSFTSATTAVCTVSGGGALTFVAAGTCTIDADQAGNAAFNAASTVTQSFAVNAIAPGAPTIGTATAGDAQATVTFTAPASNGGAAITGYTVTSNPGGLTGTGTGSPIVVTGLSNGVSYTFTVTATNSAGTGAPSAPSNSVTPQPPFAAPTLRPDRALVAAAPAQIDVLANDAIDAVLRPGLTLSIVRAPSRGTASVVLRAGETPVLRYAANAGASGADALRYRVCFTLPQPCVEADVGIDIRPKAIAALQWSTSAERGFRDERFDALPALPAARFIAHGLVRPERWSGTVSAVAPADAPWAGGPIAVRVRSLEGGPAGRDWRVLADAAGADIDLFLGIDRNGNGAADPEELGCASSSAGGGERCDLAFSAPAGTALSYWALVRSSAGNGFAVDLFETPLDRPAVQRSLVATGPGQVEANGEFTVRFVWDQPDFLPGQSRGGWVEMRSQADVSLGWLPVRLDRTSGEPTAFALASGVPHALALVPGQAHERLFIDVPTGATRLEVTTSSAGEIDLALARVPFVGAVDAVPSIAPAPPRAQADARSAQRGGNERIVIANPAPGRWYVTPSNNPIASNADLVVTATLEGRGPTLRPGGFFNPARSGSGLFVYPAGGEWAALWYTFKQDGSPTWYYLQAAAPGANGVWRSRIFRSAWDGARNQLSAVGEATVTPVERGRFAFSYTLDGETGSEAFVDFGGGCPTVGGAPIDASGHWFDPRRAGSGYTAHLFPNYEFYMAFVYDSRGVPRSLVAERPGIGAARQVIPLEQLEGACPLCVRMGNPARRAVGQFERDIAGGRVARIAIDARFVQGVPGAWAANDDAVTPLGALRGCASN